MGCKESSLKFTKTKTEEIETLHKWLNYKDSDWGMEKYNSNRTQYVDIINFIDLSDLTEILNDLYSIHKKKHPFSEISDFIEDCFGYTIYQIKKYIEKDFTWIGAAPSESKYTFYYYYERPNNEFIDVAIDEEFDIKDCKGYFTQILKILNDFLNINVSQKIEPVKKATTKQIVHPFNNDRTLEVFNFLNENATKRNLVLYTYIYQFLIDEKIDSNLVQADYFSYVREHVNTKVRDRKIQPNASNQRVTENLKELFKTYQSELKS